MQVTDSRLSLHTERPLLNTDECIYYTNDVDDAVASKRTASNRIKPPTKAFNALDMRNELGELFKDKFFSQ
ncbi:hypothetical protein K1T71_009208 [Dendrolimus kikuchii]|uniref:Uncharacterized protein n=1 Tax=Dendrolimus kikuchii TaxID=765133 RepID=A0ACC1CTZ2_9NEOP|nr:hypothetical protein K1T71_009208 [Dendrolimus kikuchii]